MYKKTICIAFAACAIVAQAQTQGGGISPQMLQEIQKEQKQCGKERVIANAIYGMSIDALAKNYKTAALPIDTHFSIETRKQSITDQKSSGRCWMFSGLNVLRSNYMSHADSVSIEFSQAYPKYGLVPSEVMPETYTSENTSKARSLISSKLREFGLQLRDMVAKKKSAGDIQKAKTEMLTQIYRMLKLTLGAPVEKFTYAFRDKNGRQLGEAKEYTPLSFYKEVVGDDIKGTFIMVMNDPRREYYKTYEVEYDRHTYDGTNWRYLNLPMDEIEKLAIASLKDGRKMYSSYDVGKLLDRKRGYASLDNFDYGSVFGTTFKMDKAQRISTFDSGSTHAMTLTAVDLDAKGNPMKWKVENSWGATSGQQGCIIMTAEWFREYMFRLVVNKKYVSDKLLKAYETKPVMVMPEDPLFLPDE